MRRQARKALWQEAAKDPLFTKDMEEVESDFRYADAETAGQYGLMTDFQWAVIEAKSRPRDRNRAKGTARC